MDLLSLPVEILLHISSYLPVEDILSCSLTCHHLHNIFNDNSVWKRYLSKYARCLESLEQKVNPIFQPPHSFLPLCENRLHFMRQIHLLNNWTRGHFTSHVLQDSCDIDFTHSGIRSTIRGKGNLIFKDHYVFLSAYFGSFEAIELWNIDKEPVVSSVFRFTTLLFDEYFHIVESNLVIFDCCKVNVYSIEDSDFPHKFSFLVDGDKVVFGNNDNIKHATKCFGWNHHIVGHKLVSIKHCELTVHVWDLLVPSKSGSFDMLPYLRLQITTPITTYNRNLLSVECFSNDDIILSFHAPVCFKGFNLATKDFSKFELNSAKKIRHIMMDDGYVVTFDHADQSTERNAEYYSICTLYSFQTSEQLQKRCFRDAIPNFDLKTKIVNGQFVMLCVDQFEIVDLKTLDTLQCFDSGSAYFISNTLDILGSLFVVVCTKDYKVEVWDIKNEIKCTESILLGIHPESRIYINRTCTKVVCCDWTVGSIVVMNFW